MTDEHALDDFDAQIEHLEANAALLDEYSDIEDEGCEREVECNDTDIICIEGYNTHLINMNTGHEMTITDVEEFMNDIDQVIECNNSHVTIQDDVDTGLPPIDGAIDSACNGHLIDNRHMNHVHITQLKDCKGVGVQGVDRSVPPIPVLFTARHKLLGRVFMGKFGKNLISVSRLFLDAWSMDGEHNHLHMRKNGEIMFTGHRDGNNMFIANITGNT